MTKSTKNTVYKKKKRGKKSRARIKRIKNILVFIILVTAIVLFARSSVFNVDKINVVGNKKYSTNEVIERTGFVTGKNVFKMLGEKPKNLLSLRFNDKEQSLYTAMPYIKTVSVRPALHKAISIKIEERIPFAILETQGTSLLIDKEGYALEIIKTPELKNKYLKVMGISLHSYKLGHEVIFKGRTPLNELVEFCNVLLKNDKTSKLKLFEKISSVDLSEQNNMIVLFDNRITARFGDMENINYKVTYFRQLFVNNITAKQKGTLDFTMSSNPFFVPK